jgi:malic enzyme
LLIYLAPSPRTIQGFFMVPTALANLISDDELNEEYIIPAAFDKRVGPAVAAAVAEAARKTGVARI